MGGVGEVCVPFPSARRSAAAHFLRAGGRGGWRDLYGGRVVLAARGICVVTAGRLVWSPAPTGGPLVRWLLVGLWFGGCLWASGSVVAW